MHKWHKSKLCVDQVDVALFIRFIKFQFKSSEAKSKLNLQNLSTSSTGHRVKRTRFHNHVAIYDLLKLTNPC